MKKENTDIHICYHPTSIILVDDNKEFLVSMSTRLQNNDGFSFYFYDNPKIALKKLHLQKRSDSFINRCFIRNEDDSTLHQVNVDFDVTTLHQEIYNAQRFTHITDGIVDYGMPKMNGAEFFSQVTDPMFQKIMLTGEADKNLAVELFNDGRINKFIMKHTPDLIPLLQSKLQQIKQAFFAQLSREALSKVTNETNHALYCLSDPAFIKLFNECYQQANAIEYYLLDMQGSFLFLDKFAKPNWLIVVSEEEMRAYYQTALYGYASASVTQALKEKTMLPFIPLGERQMPTTSWENYLYPAQILEGKTRYYYAYISEPKVHDLKLDKILSYQSYVDNIYKKYLEEFYQANYCA